MAENLTGVFSPLTNVYFNAEKKTLRKSTADRTKQIAEREKNREARQKILKGIAAQKRVAEVRRLTQEELLEEAKVTEELNLMSLGIYRHYYVALNKIKPVIKYDKCSKIRHTYYPTLFLKKQWG